MPLFRTILTVLFLAVAPLAHAAPDWSPYARILINHLTPGEKEGARLVLVDYAALGKDPDFQRAVDLLKNEDPSRMQKREKMAFYINAYNILALKMVADRWPLSSIKDAAPWYASVWNKEAGEINGKTVTLDQVEHEILRPMGDARIHMAVVCASVSCPDLRREPFTAAALDEQLDDQARRFLNNPAKGARVEGAELRVSKIFSWFDEDFGDPAAFVLKYRPDLPKNLSFQADIPYNWNVNGIAQP